MFGVHPPSLNDSGCLEGRVLEVSLYVTRLGILEGYTKLGDFPFISPIDPSKSRGNELPGDGWLGRNRNHTAAGNCVGRTWRARDSRKKSPRSALRAGALFEGQQRDWIRFGVVGHCRPAARPQ